MFVFWTIFRWVRRFIYLCVLGIFIYFVVTSGQVIQSSVKSDKVPVISGIPVIVVIGSATTKSISDDLEQRCALGYSLYKNLHAKVMIVTGPSSAKGEPSEAAVAAGWLAGKHIKDIKQAATGEIPAQLGEVASMLTAAERSHVVLIADPIQTKWLDSVARAEGLTVQIAPAPAPKVSFWQDLGTIWRQSLAVGYGRIFGYKSSGWLGG